jgi:hypothetical protein
LSRNSMRETQSDPRPAAAAATIILATMKES